MIGKRVKSLIAWRRQVWEKCANSTKPELAEGSVTNKAIVSHLALQKRKPLTFNL